MENYSLKEKKKKHESFWNGQGPSLILIPPGETNLYDMENYPGRFENPRLMWECEIQRARPVLDWPTDGIATIRPNLGTIFIPSMTGQPYKVTLGQMPWPGEPLSLEKIEAAREIETEKALLMQRSLEFYRLHREEGTPEIAPYLPDTQGVFDIAHLLRGDTLFYDIILGMESPEVREVMEVSLELFIQATVKLKKVLGESPCAMMHGHGMEQGVYFSTCGTRVSEDTATLVSPALIEEVILPYIRRSIEPFGGGFVHYCGNSPQLYEALCAEPMVRAIDLGNPEMYDTAWLMEKTAESGTVLYGRLAAEQGEDWRSYIKRLSSMVQSTGARCILRPQLFPLTLEEAEEMLSIWHENTEK